MSSTLRVSDAHCRRAAVRRALDVLIAIAVLVGGTAAAEAAFTTDGCLAQKRKSWSNLRKCLGTEEAKALQGKVPDLAKCQTKHQDKLATITGKAEALSVPCRYRDNGDGTVTDYDTGLQWEQKTNDFSVHDKDTAYTWTLGVVSASGSVFHDFLSTLNQGTSGDGVTAGGCFADHCDWRLPTIVELRTILDCTQGSACIDESVFGPTLASNHWSATSHAGDLSLAWYVGFSGIGSVNFALKGNAFRARAVRAIL